MRVVEIPTNPYSEKKRLFMKKQYKLHTGVNVLIGCNGSGKSTFLHMLKIFLDKQGIKNYSFDNLSDGGSNMNQRLLLSGNLDMLAQSKTSSEGERLNLACCVAASQIGQMFRQNREEKELWILMDAVDSGLSIDNIVDQKDFFRLVLIENKVRDVYIVVAANSYEMAKGERCIDVRTGTEYKFEDDLDYPKYRDFIMKSRAAKDKRYGVEE